MSCNKPLAAFQSYPGEQLIFFHKGKGLTREIRTVGDWFLDLKKEHSGDGKLLAVPCGQCSGCRLERSRQWAVRVMLESMYHDPDTCWFLTLTYDDEHLPMSDQVPHSFEGEYLGPPQATLYYPDVQAFMKRVRSWEKYHHSDDRIAFLCSGEYGDRGSRPHYHLCIMGLHIDDLRYGWRNDAGNFVCVSDQLTELWSNGIVGIGQLTFDSAAYTARYIMKKQTGKNSHIYADLGITPEFCTQSRRPGLARQYYDDHVSQIYSLDKLYIADADGVPHEMRPPKYFDRCFDIDHHEVCEILKMDREAAAEASMSDLRRKLEIPYEQYLMIRDKSGDRIVSSLKRN